MNLSLVKLIAWLVPVLAFISYYNLSMEKERYEPHIYTLTGGKVLVAKISGDPDITIDTAGTTLYSASRKLRLSPSYISARHSDWKQRNMIPRKDWVVYYSRMVPETAVGLADIKDTASVNIYYERRQKTDVAQIVHVGSYEEIPESLNKIRRFVDEKGYRINGFYEEVYLVFESIEPNPNKYETLLRYQITR